MGVRLGIEECKRPPRPNPSHPLLLTEPAGASHAVHVLLKRSMPHRRRKVVVDHNRQPWQVEATGRHVSGH